MLSSRPVNGQETLPAEEIAQGAIDTCLKRGRSTKWIDIARAR